MVPREDQYHRSREQTRDLSADTIGIRLIKDVVSWQLATYFGHSRNVTALERSLYLFLVFWCFWVDFVADQNCENSTKIMT